MRHGGEIYGEKTIQYDFSVNINPLGMPEEACRELRENLDRLTQYPDQDCRQLRSALERFTGVPAQQILCGNGASELIEATVRAISPGSILLTAPSFSGYRHAAEGFGAQIRYHALRRDEAFELTERYLEDLEQCPDMAILCSPANPVGNLIDPSLLERIALICERQGTWLLVDECFMGLVPLEHVPWGQTSRAQNRQRGQTSRAQNRPWGQTSQQWQNPQQWPQHLLVLDAFTKQFAMPGIRLGYLMAGDREILEKIRAQQPEWSVSVPAQIAGAAALRASDEYLERSRRLVASERARLAAALSKLGFAVYPGAANYIFFSTKEEIFEPLLEEGILIRRCGNYEGLEESDYRVAVLQPEANDRLLLALRRIVRGSNT